MLILPETESNKEAESFEPENRDLEPNTLLHQFRTRSGGETLQDNDPNQDHYPNKEL